MVKPDCLLLELFLFAIEHVAHKIPTEENPGKVRENIQGDFQGVGHVECAENCPQDTSQDDRNNVIDNDVDNYVPDKLNNFHFSILQ